jgi:CysZ protein
VKRPGFFDGLGYPLRGLSHLLSHRELWPYAVKALVVGVILFMILAAIAAALVLGVPGRLFSDGLTWKTGFLGCAAALLGVIGGIVLFALIGNVIAGPYLEAMTERMMADSGRVRETPRGYWAAFRAGLLDQAGRFLLFLAVQAALLGSYLTPAAFLHPLVAAAVTVFFVALEHLEYPLEARGLRFFARIEWALRHPAPALGFGATLFFVMPFAGFVLLPAAVCGAALLEQELEQSKSTAGVPSA